MAEYILQTRDLGISFGGLKAAHTVNISIQKNQIYGLIGPNGAGKTTLIKMLCSLTKPSAGSAFVCGHNVESESMAVKGVIGVCPQETAVAPNLTVKENIEFICGAHGFNKEMISAKTSELISLFKLDGIVDKKAGKLSGGWQRRLSIAMALVSEPKVLFLDEPTLGLDVIARHELWTIIRSLKGKTTVILTTHYLEEANELSDRIGIMKNGELLVVATAEELIKTTGANSFEKAFISIAGGAV